MTLARSPFVLTSFFLLLSLLNVDAQLQTGKVSSTVDQPSDSTPATTTDPKPLPWKFLASPKGVLDSKTASSFESGAACSNLTDNAPSAAVEALLSATVGTDVVRKLKGQKSQYVVIHIVDPDTTKTNADVDAKPDPKSDSNSAKPSDNWYLYRSAKRNWGEPSKWTCEKFTGQRIYGAQSILFLFLHLHANTVTLKSASEQLDKALKDAQTAAGNTENATKAANDATAAAAKSTGDAALADKKTAADKALADAKKISDVPSTKGLAQVKSSSPDALAFALKTNALDTGVTDDPKILKTLTFCDNARGGHFHWFGDFGVPDASANVHYEAAVVKRTPPNVENLKTILGLLFGAHSKDASCVGIDATTDVAIWGAGQIKNIGLPSDVSIAGYSQAADSPLTDQDRTAKQIGSVGAYNDESLYWWDASIGIPVHKIKDLQYSDTDNTVTAKQVDQQSAYAMFNLMPRPIDLTGPSFNVRFLVGFPLASSPWDKLFAGGAIGLPWKPFQNFQFFAGATFLRTTQPATLTAGSDATNAQLQNDLGSRPLPNSPSESTFP